MLDDVACVCEQLAALPSDPSRAGTDPWPVVQLVNSAGALVQTTAVDATIDELRAAREQLWRALSVASSDMLSAQNFIADSDHPVCVGELVVLATLRMTELLRPSANVDACCVTEIPWTADLTRPVLASSMGEIIDALQTTRTAFVERPYSDALVELVELLEFACARMLFSTGTRGIFDLDDNYCRPAAGATADEWMVTPAFLQLVWPTLLGFQRCLLEARCLLGTNDDAPVRDEEAAARMRRWLVRRSEQTVYRDPAPSLKRLVVRLHMRPGDRELYRLQHPTVTTSDAGIVAASVGDTRMSDINRRVHLTPSACIREHVNRTPETLELGICAHDFIDMLTRGSPGCEWAQHYARFSLEMDANEVQRMSSMHPFLVYMFNGWQLAYAGCVRWYNSFVDAFVAWLRILDTDGAASQSTVFAAAARADIYNELRRYVLRGLEPTTAADVQAAPMFIL